MQVFGNKAGGNDLAALWAILLAKVALVKLSALGLSLGMGGEWLGVHGG